MIIQGDCLEVLPTLPEASADAIVTDPPYGLEFMGKEWDKLWTKRDKHTEATRDRSEAVMSYGDTGTAARFFYSAKASRKERGEGNTHPTVKPLALMRWLVRLVCPPGGVVLDPFAGSGTTGLACIREGRHFVLIERDPSYCRICTTRTTIQPKKQKQLWDC